jgi:hypothetical protein
MAALLTEILKEILLNLNGAGRSNFVVGPFNRSRTLKIDVSGSSWLEIRIKNWDQSGRPFPLRHPEGL